MGTISGTVYELPCLRFRTPFLWPQYPREFRLHALDKSSASQRATAALVPLEQVEFLLVRQGQKLPPVADHLRQGRALDQRIVRTAQMRPGAAPGVVLGVLHQPRRHRVHLDIAGCGEKMGQVHGEGGKTFLPEVAAPVFTKVDAAGVAAVGLADGPRQGVFAGGDGDQVDVVRHQAPGPDLDPALVAPFGHQGEIGPVVVVAEEGLLATITPLGDVMGDAGGYDAGDSGHWRKIAEGEGGFN